MDHNRLVVQTLVPPPWPVCHHETLLPGLAWALVARWRITLSALQTITCRLIPRRGHIVSPILHYQMAPIVDPSWPRMGSDLENPFQNVPGRFIYALPNLRSSLYFGPSTSGVPSTSSPRHTPLEGQVAPLPCDENLESEPKLGETDPELDANPRSDSRTHTRSPSSPTSSTSSEKGRTTEKTKRSRRRRRRERPVVDAGGCVMGPRMFLFRPYWTIVPPSPWSPGDLGMGIEPQRVSGY